MHGADAPKVWSGVTRWMLAVLLLAAFRTCSTGLWSGAYGGRRTGGDALQRLTGLVEIGQCSGVVESGVARDDRGPVGPGSAVEPVQREDCLSGVLVPLDRVRLDLVAGRREGAGERPGRLPPVRVQSGALSSGEPHAAGPGLVLQAGLLRRVDLPAVLHQLLDPGRRLGHPFRDGRPVTASAGRARRLEARPAELQEQPVQGIRPVPGAEPGSSRRRAGPGHPGTRRARPPGRAAGREQPRVPASGGGRGSAAFWFPARPAGTEHILLARHPASHSCTVLSVRSTVSAMMLVLAPSEAYREDDLRAYQQASSDMLQNAAGAVPGWVSENWEYIAAGGMAAAGVAVMCTGIGRPIGAAMMAGALTRRRQHLNPEILQRRRGLGHRPTRRRRRRRHRPDRRRSPPRIS